MKEQLRILFIEDSKDDAFLILHQIEESGYEVVHERVDRAEEMKAALKKKTWDIVLSDFKMPYFNGLDALAIFKETGIDIPFIIISGMIGEDLAVEAMRLGANDYIMKDNLRRLVPAIERELRETAVRAVRRQDEEQLALLNFALNHVREAVFLIDEDSFFRYVNEEACRFLGYTRTELLGMTVPDIDPDILSEGWPGHWNVYKGDQSLVFESSHRAKDGRILPVEVHANYFEYEGRGYHLALVRDITERKQAEKALYRLNRELKAVSECNKALLRATDETTLLREICRIICDKAGHRAVWVGFTDPDNMEDIDPAAWAGFDDKDMDIFRFNRAGEMRYRESPAAIAARNGDIVLVQNFKRDPKAAKLRAHSFLKGLRSCICLPIKDANNAVFGVLNIFSSEVDAFSPDETQLLKTLADDLAFGIRVIRGRTEHRISERKLRESEQRWRLTLEAVQIGVWDWDVANDTWYASPTYYTMLGYEPKLGPTDRNEWMERLHPEDREKVVGKIQAVLSGNFEQYRYEARMRHANGTYRWQQVLGSAIEHGPDGKVSRLLGIRMDVDERKQAEQALLEAERKYRTLVDNIPDCIARFDLQGRHLFVNSAVIKLFQAPADFFIGRTLKDISSSGNQAEFALLDARIQEAFVTGVSNTVETRWTLADGVHDVEILHAPEKDENGKVVSVLGIAHDITSRKEAENRLRESETKYRRIVDTATEGIFILDEQYMITFANARMAEMIGYEMEFLIGRPLTNFIFKEDLPYFQERIEKRRRGIPERYNIRGRHRNGKAVWIHVSAVPIQDSEGKFKGSFSMLTDITELKRVEQSQKEQIRFLQCMERVHRAIQDNQDFDRLMDALLDVVLDIFASDRAFLAFPCDPESSFWQIAMERNRPEYPGAKVQGAIAMEPYVANFHRRLLAADGPVVTSLDTEQSPSSEIYKRWQIKSFLSMAIYPKVGKPWHFGIHQCSRERVWNDQEIRMFKEIGQRFEAALTGVLMYRDLKESEEKLREAERRMTRFLSNIPGFVYTFRRRRDGGYYLPYVSAGIKSLYGLEPEDVREDMTPLFMKAHPEDRPRIEASIEEAYRTMKNFTVNFRICRTGQPERWMEARSLPEREADGEIVWYGIMFDITERKQLEKDLFLAKKLEVIGRLAGGVAHEVRNPLNAILAISEALFKEKEIAGNPEYLPYITHIRTQVNRLSKLMTDLLELGKPVLPTNISLVPLDQVCAEAIQLWNQTNAAREHYLVFVCDVEPGSALVYTDRAKLQQVIFNLLDNAGQCSPKESKIRVVISDAGDGKISVTVKDQGMGIAPENLEWVFEPFFSLRKGGTGLGLALVKQFIENIGGTVEIRNNDPPPGCTIELILNLSENKTYESENSAYRG